MMALNDMAGAASAATGGWKVEEAQKKKIYHDAIRIFKKYHDTNF